MHVLSATDVLQPHGLLPPDLEFLRPNEHQYTALLMQPSGPIFASTQRIGPAASALAAAKGRKFLEMARARNAHLVVTPEYYLPWSTLIDAINGGTTPPEDALWVLGSESITQDGLDQFKLDVAAHCLVLHEPWENLTQDRSLLDPAVLLFQARRPDQSTQLVALVQFKTYPSRDETFFEEALLRTGRQIYKFSGKSGHLSAATIICSDAFAVEPPALSELNYQSTIIHIQLNPAPTHSVYRRYRTMTFETAAKATNCHIVCLNWAHLIEEVDDQGVPKPWNNIAASTWYCPKDECSSKDNIVTANHRLGLYYTYMSERRHALRFHSQEAVFELLVPKLLRLTPAIMANHNGPSMVDRRVWDVMTQDWVAGPVPAIDGSATYLAANPGVNAALTHVLAANDPLAIERVLALSTGDISGRDTWHSLESIDSCTIESDEVMRRISVVQDNQGNDFRYRRVSAIAEIHHEIGNQIQWPKQVAGLDGQSTVQWSLADPNFNVRTSGGIPTLVVYLDETHSPSKIETKADKLYELLRKAGGEHQQRLCIIRREHGQLRFVQIPALTRFDEANLDQTEFTAIHPFEPKESGNG
jgi:predicted amidohydrolase